MTKKITILGCGETGLGAALLAKAKGYDVLVWDNGNIAPNKKYVLQNNDIPYEEAVVAGATTTAKASLLDSLFVIKSPGISNNNDTIKALVKNNIPIISDLDFAYKFIPVPIIAVTGTNGKTTTTALLGHMLSYKYKVAVCGNIGVSICTKVLEGGYDIYVVEVSSYQLEDIKDFRCNIAIITNISPDHLDRYNYDMDQYVDAKCKIFNIIEGYKDYSSGYSLFGDVIYPHKDPFLEPKMRALKITTNSPFRKHPIIKDSNIYINNPYLKEGFNLLNALMVAKVAEIFGIDIQTFNDVIDTFVGLEHRLEYVASIDGIKIYNDSKATNIGAVEAALKSFDSAGAKSNSIIWIAGGQDKGNDYNAIAALVEEKVKHLICLGADNTYLKQAFAEKFVFETQKTSEAVEKALKIAQVDDIILLSPACASFDLFKNFEERGRMFKKCVLENL